VRFVEMIEMMSRNKMEDDEAEVKSHECKNDQIKFHFLALCARTF
jgi:nitrate reductase NapE component